MKQLRFDEPTEIVIWSTSTLLALVLGIGSAFVLWMALHRDGEGMVASLLITLLGIGLIAIGWTAPRVLTRLFLIAFAVALVLGFVLGGPGFAHLAA